MKLKILYIFLFLNIMARDAGKKLIIKPNNNILREKWNKYIEKLERVYGDKKKNFSLYSNENKYK